MTAWPGGACPSCGEQVPAKVVHCQYCRALLNPELESDSVEIPVFVPLREISTMIEVEHRGYYTSCPICQKELRINKKYVGVQVQCKHCNGEFPLDFSRPDIEIRAIYCNCPHCEKELRAAPKYMGMKVGCKHCQGQIHFVGDLD